MASRVYDRTVPADATTVAGTIGTAIQQKGQDFDERHVQGGHKMGTLTHSAAAQEQDGKHCVGIEDALGTDAGVWTLWSFDGLTPLFRIYGKDHATKPGQVEALTHGGVDFAFIGKNVTSGLDVGHQHTRIYPISGALLPSATNVSVAINAYFLGSCVRWSGPAGKITKLITAINTVPGVAVKIAFRKTVGLPGDVNVFSDAVSTVSLGIVTIGAASFHIESTLGAPVTVNDGDYITVKVDATSANAYPGNRYGYFAVAVEG